MILEVVAITEAFVIAGLAYKQAIHKCASALIIQGEAKVKEIETIVTDVEEVVKEDIASAVVVAEDNFAVIGVKMTDAAGKIVIK